MNFNSYYEKQERKKSGKIVNKNFYNNIMMHSKVSHFVLCKTFDSNRKNAF